MYNVYIDDKKVGETESNSFQLKDLKPDTTYKIGVSKTSENKESDISYIDVTTEKENIQENDVETQTVVENYEELTVAKLKDLLDSRGIDYPSNARKQELIDIANVEF